MAILMDQPTAAPVRKMWAVIIAGIVVGAVQGGILAACEAGFAPACAIPDLSAPITSGVTALVMIVAGYMTREQV